MADETTTETAEEVQTTEQVEAPQSAETTDVQKPHPLSPGGERWNEIYRERSDYKREAETLRQENERLRQQPPQQQAQQQQVYSQDQLQALVDSGKITPAQMAGQLVLQGMGQVKQDVRRELKQEQTFTAAQNEVRDYLARVPALNSPGSPEFVKAQQAAWEIADEMGVPVSDPRVMRRALRETLGTPDKLAKVTEAREYARTNADTHTETGGGGGRSAPSSKNDPLKQVGDTWLSYNRRFAKDEKDLRGMAQLELDRRSSRRR